MKRLNLKQLKKIYLGNFYVHREENGGPITIYRIDDIKYEHGQVHYGQKDKFGYYDFSCVQFVIFGLNGGYTIKWEPCKLAYPYFRMKTKRCSRDWVRLMVKNFHEDANRFVDGKRWSDWTWQENLRHVYDVINDAEFSKRFKTVEAYRKAIFCNINTKQL